MKSRKKERTRLKDIKKRDKFWKDMSNVREYQLDAELRIATDSVLDLGSTELT